MAGTAVRVRVGQELSGHLLTTSGVWQGVFWPHHFSALPSTGSYGTWHHDPGSPWANNISLTSSTRMTQPSLLIHLPRHPPVSVVSARPRQCSVCVFHGQRLKFKTSSLDHSYRLFWSTEIPLTQSRPSHISEVYSHLMDTADQTSAGGSLWPPQ